MKSKGAIFGLVIIASVLIFCAFTYKSTLVNYVPFTDAQSATDSTVQVMGKPLDPSMENGGLQFKMDDGKGHVMAVLYNGPKPDDFDSAVSRGYKIAAQGTYRPQQQLFVADNLLVKCPSKYQGAQKPSGGASS